MKYLQTDTPLRAYLLRLRFIWLLPIVIGRDLRACESLPNQIQYLFRPTMSIHSSFRHDAFAKVRNKLEKKKEKGEKFENNVGMTIFLQKYLVDCFLICIFATSNVCLTIRVSFPRGQDYIDTTHFKRVASATLFILETSS